MPAESVVAGQMLTRSSRRRESSPAGIWLARGWLLIGALACAASPVAAQGAPADTGYSAAFACPESLPDSAARVEAVRRFVVWAQRAHPEWTLEEFLAYRMELLVSHHCVAASDPATRAREEPERPPELYRCRRDTGEGYFSARAKAGCTAVNPLPGWVEVAVRTTMVLYLWPPSVAPGAGWIEVQTMRLLPARREVEGVPYDRVDATVRLYCGQMKTQLRATTYRLAGREVRRVTPHSEALREIEPGSLAAELYELVCEGQEQIPRRALGETLAG